MHDKGTPYQDRLRPLDLWSLPSSVANSEDEGDSASHRSSDNGVAEEAHDAALKREADDISLQSWPIKTESVVESDTEPPKRKLARISKEVTHTLMKDLDERTRSAEGHIERQKEYNEQVQISLKALTRDLKTIKAALAIVEKRLDGFCLAKVYKCLGKFQDAATLLKRVISVQKTVCGDDHFDTRKSRELYESLPTELLD